MFNRSGWALVRWTVAGAMLLGCATASPSLAYARPGSPAALFAPEKKWIKHRVIPKETLDSIGARYGVTRAAIIRWNKKKLGKKAWIYAGQKLSIHAAEPVPPPRAKTSYRVKFGDTWSKIARHYGVPVSHLRAWNKKVPKSFKAGTTLVVWTNPAAVPIVDEDGGVAGSGAGVGAVPTIAVKGGGLSIGKPNRGRLNGGIHLPDSEMYVVRDADKAYGATHAVEQLVNAIAQFRAASGYDQKLIIGAISLRNGGRFRPHKSHQSGRDVDVRMPRKPGVKRVKSTNDIDWGATWELIKALGATGQVEYIFMSSSRQRLLHRAAKARGASSDELKKLIQYPRKAKTNNGLVRHAKGHDSHIHVRFKCASSNKRCESY